MSDWETAEEVCYALGNGQWENGWVVDKDEADKRIAELEAERDQYREALEAIRSMDVEGQSVFHAYDEAYDIAHKALLKEGE